MVEIIFYISGIMFFGVSITLMLKFYLFIYKMSDTTLIDAIMSNPEVEAAQKAEGVKKEGTSSDKTVDDKTSSLMTEAITKSMAKVYTNFVKTAVPINEPETLEQEICDDPFLKSAIKDNLPFLNKYGMFPFSNRGRTLLKVAWKSFAYPILEELR